MTTNKYILDWVKEMAEMTCPDNIVWIDGSEEQAEKLQKMLDILDDNDDVQNVWHNWDEE